MAWSNGLDQRRLESDALRFAGDFDRQGNYLLYARHDGGNAVAAHVPYELHRLHNKYGALKDISAASLGSYSSLLRINMETYDVMSATYIFGYNPIIDFPSAGFIYLGEWPYCGRRKNRYGMIETSDAWYDSFLKQRENPNRGELLSVAVAF